MVKKRTWDFHIRNRESGEEAIVTGDDKQSAIIKAKLDPADWLCYQVEEHTAQPSPPPPDDNTPPS